MFRLKDHAISPQKAVFERAIRNLPRAHAQAQRAGISHLHQRVTNAVDMAGLDSSPITVGWRRGTPHLGIDHSVAGNALADQEYGTPDEAPMPVIRQAARRAHPEAQEVYRATLHAGLGL